jgi:hypothetical protein
LARLKVSLPQQALAVGTVLDPVTGGIQHTAGELWSLTALGLSPCHTQNYDGDDGPHITGSLKFSLYSFWPSTWQKARLQASIGIVVVVLH